jgi:hypothetical protein
MQFLLHQQTQAPNPSKKQCVIIRYAKIFLEVVTQNHNSRGACTQNHNFRVSFMKTTTSELIININPNKMFFSFNTKTDAMAHTLARWFLMSCCCYFLYSSSNCMTVTLDPQVYVLALLSFPMSAPLHQCRTSRSVAIDTTTIHRAATAALAFKQGILGEWWIGPSRPV